MTVGLPVVDVSPYTVKPGGGRVDKLLAAKRKTCATKIHNAIKEFGFLYITGHNVPQEHLDHALSLAHQFFALEREEKEKIGIWNEDLSRGYQRVGDNVTQGKRDCHEALDCYAPAPPGFLKNAVPPHPHLSGRNQYPADDVIEGFRSFFEQTYIPAMLELGRRVMKAIADGLGLPRHGEIDEFDGERKGGLDKFIDRSFWVMRIIGYPPLQRDAEDGAVSCGEHTDYGCLTLLNQDCNKRSLLVRNKEGAWISANPIEGALVVNIGDMMNVWTNNLYRSTPHKVIHAGPGSRVSVPFFYEPNFDAVIRPPAECLQMQRDEAAKAGLDPASVKDEHFPVKYGNHLLSKVKGNFDVSDKRAGGGMGATGMGGMGMGGTGAMGISAPRVMESSMGVAP